MQKNEEGKGGREARKSETTGKLKMMAGSEEREGEKWPQGR